jgi:hypothetical protein
VAVPAPQTWVNSVLVAAADLNREIRDTASFILNPPHVAAFRSAALTVPTSSSTLVQLDGEQYDWSVTAMHDTVTNNSRLIAPEDGLYDIRARTLWAANATGDRELDVRLNAAGASGGGTLVVSDHSTPQAAAGINVTAQRDWPMVAGDYIELFVFQSSGGNLGVTVGVSGTWMQMRWVSKS